MAKHVQGVIYLLHFDRPVSARQPLHREDREFGITEGGCADRR
jgi:hypothetical protein